jgi:hypothetical protein
MDPSTRISDREENDLAAQGIWESEGGNPGRLQKLPGDKIEELASGEAHASDPPIAPLTEVKNKVSLPASRQGKIFQILDQGDSPTLAGRELPGNPEALSPNDDDTCLKTNSACI